MRYRARKRLYERALRDYVEGWVDGAQARDADAANARVPLLAFRESHAYAAGAKAGRGGERANISHLPVEVWALVLAEAQRPD